MRNSPGVKPVLRAIRRVAAARGVPVRVVGRGDIRKAFREHRAKTKYEIAGTIAAMFPELVWRLPPKREIYESEASSMTIFDAVAVGVTYYQMLAAPILKPESCLSPFAGPAADERVCCCRSFRTY
jgi:hypothetical protein